MNTLEINLKNKDAQKKVKLSRLSYYSLSTAVIFYMVLAFAFLASCSKDDAPIDPKQEDVIVEDVLPTLSLVSGSEGVFEGVIGAPGNGSLQHTVKATAAEGFMELNIYKVENGVKSSYISFDKNHPDYVEGSNSFTHNLGYIFTENDVNKELYFIAEVIDTKNNIETLDFADALVKKPMQFVTTIFMETRLPLESFNLNIAQFLKVEGEKIAGVNLGKVVNDQINDKIAAIISYSEDAGYYLSSPKAVLDQDVVIKIQDKAKTKFKTHEDKAVEFGDLNIYDTFIVEDLYNEADFGQHQQKAKQIHQGSLISMKTDDDRIALFKIDYFEVINNSEVYLTMNMYITQ